MKRDQIVYWGTTGVVALMMVFSSYMYLSQNAQLMQNFQAIGYPAYIVPFLGIAKLLGALALVVTKWDKVTEWAYAGFAFTFLGATYSHLATHTPFVMPLVFLVLLGVSYWFKIRLAVAHK